MAERAFTARRFTRWLVGRFTRGTVAGCGYNASSGWSGRAWTVFWRLPGSEDSPADLQGALRATLCRRGIVVAENDPVLETAAICNAAVADTLAAVERATARIESAQVVSTEAEAARGSDASST
jgi:hypothetical protein